MVRSEVPIGGELEPTGTTLVGERVEEVPPGLCERAREGFGDERVLVSEVGVERAVRETRRRHQLVDADGADAVLAEQSRGMADDARV